MHAAIGNGYFVAEIRIQGSAVISKAPRDVDVGILVVEEEFDKIIKQSFKSPNPGSSKEKAMRHAISEGKITAGGLPAQAKSAS